MNQLIQKLAFREKCADLLAATTTTSSGFQAVETVKNDEDPAGDHDTKPAATPIQRQDVCGPQQVEQKFEPSLLHEEAKFEPSKAEEIDFFSYSNLQAGTASTAPDRPSHRSKRESIPCWLMSPDQVQFLSNLHTGLTPRPSLDGGADGSVSDIENRGNANNINSDNKKEKVRKTRTASRTTKSNSLAENNNNVSPIMDEANGSGSSDDAVETCSEGGAWSEIQKDYAKRFASDVLNNQSQWSRTLQQQRMIDRHRKKDQQKAARARLTNKRGEKPQNSKADLNRHSKEKAATRLDVFEVQQELKGALDQHESRKSKKE